LVDGFQLLLPVRNRPTLTHRGFLLLTKQLFKCGREQSGQLWQRRYLNPPPAGLIGLDSLLGHAQPFGQLGLGYAPNYSVSKRCIIQLRPEN
jgi:hypothetical protein